MLATTAAMDGFDTLPAPGWLTSAPKTIVGAWQQKRDGKNGKALFELLILLPKILIKLHYYCSHTIRHLKRPTHILNER